MSSLRSQHLILLPLPVPPSYLMRHARRQSATVIHSIMPRNHTPSCSYLQCRIHRAPAGVLCPSCSVKSSQRFRRSQVMQPLWFIVVSLCGGVSLRPTYRYNVCFISSSSSLRSILPPLLRDVGAKLGTACSQKIHKGYLGEEVYRVRFREPFFAAYQK